MDYTEKIKELETKHNAVVEEINNLETARQQLLGKILMLQELSNEADLHDEDLSEDGKVEKADES